ncbi:MAG: cyclic pyranopterin monophosphate synthase MoaC, partial [FCB group bacterium]|nr:cyclic pyranopterin monophosphate synthase MoaC [FCB group bacterium]
MSLEKRASEERKRTQSRPDPAGGGSVPALSHVGADGRAAMVNVASKTATRRTSHARAIVTMPPEVAERFSGGDIQSKKGPVFQTAILAGVMAAKR